MATGRDLAEAHSFGRRRLVTAFVSGVPAGSGVEPLRAGRTLVGGAALAVLLVAGAAIAGMLSPRDPAGWTEPGLVVSRETGAAYVILERSDHPVLRPVDNITSARLALDAGVGSAPRIVSQRSIDAQTVGADLGIPGAPASLPAPSRLVRDGWTACTADREGLRVAVPGGAAVRALPEGGFVVESEGAYYLVAEGVDGAGTSLGAHRYALPPSTGRGGDDQDNMLDALGLPSRSSAAQVPGEWLRLFPDGGDLDWASFRIRGFGDRVPQAGTLGLPADARVGDVLTTRSESLLLTGRAVVELSDFALAVYRNGPTPTGWLGEAPRRGGEPVEFRVDGPPHIGRADPAYAAARWPAGRLQDPGSDHCAVLDAAPGAAPTVRIATDATDDASPTTLRAGDRAVAVQPGRGAYVLAGDWSDIDRGSPFVVDAQGRSHRLVGPDAADRLGYAHYPVSVVPGSWVELFDRGVRLSVDDALRSGR